MQKSHSMFQQNLFKSFDFVFIHFSHLTFKFIQLRFIHQLLLYVVDNFPIFKFLFKFFKLKKNKLMIEEYFLDFF